MFGTLPPLPAARFEFSGEVNPEFLRVSEQLRKGAFYSDVLDMKTTQLILFGMLLAEHNTVGAQAHAAAARKAGASWEELHTVMQLAAATGALWAGQQRRRAAQDAARQGAGGKAMTISRRARRAGRGAVADRAAGLRRRLSGAEGGRLDRQGFPLPHRRGDARGAAALHHGRRADRRAGADPARHRRLRRELPERRLSPASCSAKASRSTPRNISSSCRTRSAPENRPSRPTACAPSSRSTTTTTWSRRSTGW